MTTTLDRAVAWITRRYQLVEISIKSLDRDRGLTPACLVKVVVFEVETETQFELISDGRFLSEALFQIIWVLSGEGDVETGWVEGPEL